MSVFNCSFSVFEDLIIIGAVSIERDNVEMYVSFSFFSHSTRTSKSGGAISFNSNNGKSAFNCVCFEWCFTNTPDNELDFGQTVFSICKDAVLSESCYAFSSPDLSSKRNAGFYTRYAEESIVERVNGSMGYCYYSAGVMISDTEKGSVRESSFFNMTSNSDYDTVGFYNMKETATLHRIVYVQCANPVNGYLIGGDNSNVLTVDDCVIANCTNFATNKYTSSIFTSSPEMCVDDIMQSLAIKKNKCIENHQTMRCGREGKILANLIGISLIDLAGSVVTKSAGRARKDVKLNNKENFNSNLLLGSFM